MQYGAGAFGGEESGDNGDSENCGREVQVQKKTSKKGETLAVQREEEESKKKVSDKEERDEDKVLIPKRRSGRITRPSRRLIDDDVD